MFDHVRSDKTGAAGKQNAHARRPPRSVCTLLLRHARDHEGYPPGPPPKEEQHLVLFPAYRVLLCLLQLLIERPALVVNANPRCGHLPFRQWGLPDTQPDQRYKRNGHEAPMGPRPVSTNPSRPRRRGRGRGHRSRRFDRARPLHSRCGMRPLDNLWGGCALYRFQGWGRGRFAW